MSIKKEVNKHISMKSMEAKIKKTGKDFRCIPFFSGRSGLSEVSTFSDFEASDELSDTPETLCKKCNLQIRKYTEFGKKN